MPAMERQRALINGHPDLAGKAAREGKLTADSTAEQAAAGLDRLTEEEFATFHRLNDAYRSQFAHAVHRLRAPAWQGIDPAPIRKAAAERCGKRAENRA